MTAKEMLWCEANMYAWNGKHWLDREKKARFMLYRGVVFKWDVDREVWEFANEED